MQHYTAQNTQGKRTGGKKRKEIRMGRKMPFSLHESIKYLMKIIINLIL